MIRYLIRNALLEDLDGMQRLARMLNTVNLPDEKSALQEVLNRSVASLNGQIKSPSEREFVFVVEDLGTRHIIGSSQVIAQHGTRDAPHIFFEVATAERYSNSIDRHFKHQVLRLGFNYEGPTEIGGLIVDPEYRSAPEKLGRQLSLVRFLFIAMNRPIFRDRVLAELLPPLLPNRESLLWEALGRRFTGLDYIDADHISRTNKEFIKGLFPEGQIYTCLFGDDVKDTIGKVGADSLPAKRLLESIGFSYQDRVDPFDGGPHFEAESDELDPIKNSVWTSLSPCKSPMTNAVPWLVATHKNGFTPASQFRAAVILAEPNSKERNLLCAREDIATLGVDESDQVRAYALAS